MALTTRFLSPERDRVGRQEGDRPMSEPSPDGIVAALKRELAGYVADGNADRAAQVRREIARLTGADDRTETTAADPTPERATPAKPRARKG